MEERITIEVIESKDFALENNGYSRKEVDRFLDAICDEMANLQDEIDGLQKKLAVAEARSRMTPAPAPAKASVPDDSFREILEMAQKVKSETIAAAEAKAAQIIAEAREEAAAKLGNLEADRNVLSAQVEELKAAGLDLLDKLAALLKAHQDVLDKTEGLF